MMEKRVKAALVSVISNTFLVTAKLVVGFLIGSVSVISEGIHSANDLLASFIALFAVKSASKPPDEKHNFGHGKIENISGTIEGLLIFIAACLIIKEAIEKILHGGEPLALGWGIGVMGLSALVNLLVSSYLMRVAKATHSIALEADAIHLRTDVYTSAGVFAGLLLIHFTGWTMLDPIAAILVAMLIIRAAFELTSKAFVPLIDTALSEDEVSEIKAIIENYSDKFVEYHDLRTRRSGREKHIDFHLVAHSDSSIQEVHDLCDSIEDHIMREIPHSHVLIHCEPVCCCEGEEACQAADLTRSHA
ncbi:cation diffusion facilitator family transporter [Syntrophothermus lipocalidus]|uniref:Cation diffusion facilitator family transporter n=1 Tax=Syntrophothermus lipocalidus (strain DSM 12680 / TGB-C1) TaxID=643648 RepID=D7CLG1_SYNLT|nr:cation diffusion facilitator family transporter [Syntrophothermus lipocalidus]ADI01546.1 cation diffusion facilitator family transporter [Syntrophothermus lipocalidus DSM 12680]